MKRFAVLMALLVAPVLVLGGFSGCSSYEKPKAVNPVVTDPVDPPDLGPKGPKGALDAPTVTCVGATQHSIFLRITAGASGAPAGFSLQWVKKSDYPALTCGASGQDLLWPSSDGGEICKASFSGVPWCSIYNLGPNQWVIVEVGNLNDSECGVGLSNCGADELECGTEYIFRAFAHASGGANNSNSASPSSSNPGLKRSPFTPNVCCSTESCVDESCVLTQGYWKNHPCNWPSPFSPGANDPLNPPIGQCALTGNPNQQCACDAVNTILVGALLYTQCDLLCNLALSGGGNAVRILSHQLVAAKLNILNGASGAGTVVSAIQPANPYNGSTVNSLIAAGDALIGTLPINTAFVPPGGPGNVTGPAMTAVAHLLDLYNLGHGGVPHCP